MNIFKGFYKLKFCLFFRWYSLAPELLVLSKVHISIEHIILLQTLSLGMEDLHITKIVW